VNWSALDVAEVPDEVVTVTSTPPVEAATGAVAVIEVALSAVIEALVVPNLTPVAAARLLPEIVTEVPPRTEPFDGLTPFTVGIAANGVNSAETLISSPVESEKPVTVELTASGPKT